MFRWLTRGCGSREQILIAIAESRKEIMSAIKAFAEAVTTSFVAIGASVDGLVKDVDNLKQQIQDLQNGIAPEDQALLDGIKAQAEIIASRLKSLDDSTAPENVPTPAPEPTVVSDSSSQPIAAPVTVARSGVRLRRQSS